MRRLQPAMHQNCGGHEAGSRDDDDHKPPHILTGVAKYPNEVPAVVESYQGDHTVANSAANRDDEQKFPAGIFQHSCRCEQSAGGKWKWHRSRNCEPARAPMLKIFEKVRYSTLAKPSLQIIRTGETGRAKYDVRPDDGPDRRNRRIVIPGLDPPRGQDRRENVSSAEGWKR